MNEPSDVTNAALPARRNKRVLIAAVCAVVLVIAALNAVLYLTHVEAQTVRLEVTAEDGTAQMIHWTNAKDEDGTVGSPNGRLGQAATPWSHEIDVVATTGSVMIVAGGTPDDVLRCRILVDDNVIVEDGPNSRVTCLAGVERLVQQ